MNTELVTYDGLTKLEQAIVSEARGWDGTHYHDHKSGAVIELVDDNGQTKYRIVAKGEGDTVEVATEVATEPEVPVAQTDAPVQETEPTAPATDATVPTTEAPATTDVPETTTDSAPTGEATDGTTPAATDETPKEEEKSLLGRILG